MIECLFYFIVRNKESGENSVKIPNSARHLLNIILLKYCSVVSYYFLSTFCKKIANITPISMIWLFNIEARMPTILTWKIIIAVFANNRNNRWRIYIPHDLKKCTLISSISTEIIHGIPFILFRILAYISLSFLYRTIKERWIGLWKILRSNRKYQRICGETNVEHYLICFPPFYRGTDKRGGTWNDK